MGSLYQKIGGVLISIILAQQVQAQSCGGTATGCSVPNYSIFDANYCQGKNMDYFDSTKYLSSTGQISPLGHSYPASRIRMCSDNGCGAWQSADVLLTQTQNENRVYAAQFLIMDQFVYPFFTNALDVKLQNYPLNLRARNNKGTIQSDQKFVIKNSLYMISSLPTELNLVGSMKVNCSWYKQVIKSLKNQDGIWTEAEVVFYSQY
jgi:hypothetical protein